MEPFQILWERSKLYVAVFSGLVPLIAALASLLPEGRVLDHIIQALIVYQLSFLIAVVFENGFGKTRSEVCLHQISDNPVWKKLEGKKFGETRIVALNGARLAKEIDKHDIKMKKVRAIFPSASAISAFYRSLSKDDASKQVTRVEDGINEFVKLMELHKAARKLTSFTVLRADFFPFDFYALFGNQNAIVGNYAPAENRAANIGLRATSWEESNLKIIETKLDQFENLWRKLAAEET
jgi:hypothetical protein